MKSETITKKVLILDTHNTTLSIIAEAVLNKHLRGVDAFSAGINAGKKLDENTLRLLKEEGLYKSEYKAKSFETFKDMAFDLVITLDEYALQHSPDFSQETDIIAIEYEELQKQSYSVFKKSLKLIQMEITPIVRMHFAM